MHSGSLLGRLGIRDRHRWEDLWRHRLQACAGEACADPTLLWGFALPLLSAIEAQLASTPLARPVLALQAPVGAGKSTLARQLQGMARSFGCELAVASIDDAYLEWSQREQRLAGNPFGVNRVPPGSHDPDLLLEAIALWRQGQALRLPRFDKTLRSGQGDRSGWCEQNAQALVLEGWLVGYEPVSTTALLGWDALGEHDLSPLERAWLPHWNRALELYTPLWQTCHSIWVLEPVHPERVLRWRLQAEVRQRRRGGAAMNPDAIARLVRASQASLPKALYQPALQRRAMAIAQLDGLRRCLRVTPDL